MVRGAFGMFIHWGLHTIPAGSWQEWPVSGYGEWIMNFASIPVVDYKALVDDFNPTAFNAHDNSGPGQSRGHEVHHRYRQTS